MKKKPELRTIVLPKGATSLEKAAAVLAKRHEKGPYYLRNTEILFRGSRSLRFPSERTDILPIGFDASPFKGPNAFEEMVKHLGANIPALKQVVRAISESFGAADQLVLEANPKKIPPMKFPIALQPLGVLVAHKRAHLDEFVQGPLIIHWGRGRRWSWKEGEFPPTLFVDDEQDGIAKFGQRKDAVFLGVGGDAVGLRAAVFDEHRAEGRLAETCASDLVARFLELDDHPNFQWLLSEVRRSDVEAGQGPLGLGQLLKVVQKFGDYDVESLQVWFDFVGKVVRALVYSGQAFDRPLDLGLALRVVRAFGNLSDEMELDILERVITAFQKRGVEFNETCPKEFREKGNVETLPNGRRLASVASDCYTMNAFARSQRQADVVVQRFSGGHIRLFSKPAVRAEMREIARRVMAEEMTARGKSETEIAKARQAFETLCQTPNDLPGGIPWYFHMGSTLGGASLLNGSDSHESEPTKLTLERVAELAKEELAKAAPATTGEATPAVANGA